MTDNVEIVRLRALLHECRSVIVEHAFSMEGGTDQTSWGCCVVCGASDWRGHKPDCELAAFIKRLDEFVPKPGESS